MRRQDLTNVRFEKILVKDFSHRKGKHLYWTCVCDCGNETIQCTTNLKRGKVISCGCYRNELATERLRKMPPRVKYELGVASFNVLYKQYEHGAKRRDILWELNKDQFKELTSGNCHYCGDVPKTTISRRGTNGEYTYNGVDRKDSNLSYSIQNCLPCCTTCNLLKMDIPYDDFLQQIIKICEYRIGSINE